MTLRNSGKVLQLINTFGKVAECKINIPKTIAFLFTNDKGTEKEIVEIIFKIFIIDSNNIKYLWVTLKQQVKNVCNEGVKTFKKKQRYQKM